MKSWYKVFCPCGYHDFWLVVVLEELKLKGFVVLGLLDPKTLGVGCAFPKGVDEAGAGVDGLPKANVDELGRLGMVVVVVLNAFPPKLNEKAGLSEVVSVFAAVVVVGCPKAGVPNENAGFDAGSEGAAGGPKTNGFVAPGLFATAPKAGVVEEAPKLNVGLDAAEGSAVVEVAPGGLLDGAVEVTPKLKVGLAAALVGAAGVPAGVVEAPKANADFTAGVESVVVAGEVKENVGGGTTAAVSLLGVAAFVFDGAALGWAVAPKLNLG